MNLEQDKIWPENRGGERATKHTVEQGQQSTDEAYRDFLKSDEGIAAMTHINTHKPIDAMPDVIGPVRDVEISDLWVPANDEPHGYSCLDVVIVGLGALAMVWGGAAVLDVLLNGF